MSRDHFRICVRCRVLTTQLEARLRAFNTGHCGHCGGDLVRYRDTPSKFTCPNPECGSQLSRVIRSRSLIVEEGVYRRRECVICGTRWSTREVRSSVAKN